MEATGVHVAWPSKLKIGAKSKKGELRRWIYLIVTEMFTTFWKIRLFTRSLRVPRKTILLPWTIYFLS